MKVSYAITVCDELEEIKRLVEFLTSNKYKEDEIVILFDQSKGTQEVITYLDTIKGIKGIKGCLVSNRFEGHFADWKNLLTSHCTGDFIFQIDADEYLPAEFIGLLHQILEANPEVDLYYVPRINTVSGLTEEHIQKWGWKVENGRVNYPDYQGRIYRNSSEIKWENKVHEKIVGFKQYTALPEVDALSLIHPKTIERQERQNAYYETL
jgi:glycosyltransferase involved in cell wall biosynthesis